MFVFMVFKINFIVWPIILGLVLYIKDLQTSHLKLVCRFEQSLFPPHGYFVIQQSIYPLKYKKFFPVNVHAWSN